MDIYYIGYITMNYSDYIQINSVNPVYLINDETDRYIDTLNLVSTNKSKKILKNTENTQNFRMRVNILLRQ